MEEEIKIYTDGGSRGNPGPSACAFVAEENDKVIFKGSKYLGKQTNNFAEYSGVILALQWILKNFQFSNLNSQIHFFLDSELVVKQINGIYRVKDEHLRNLFFEVLNLKKKIGGTFVFNNIPREKNMIADHLVNEELDKNM